METPVGAAVTVRERVLLELARRDKSDLRETFQAITEAAAVVLDVARVSVWQLCGDGTTPGSELEAKIVCKDLYLLNENKHVSFMPIHGRDFPAYLRAVHERRTITADDARLDPRTREFAEFYLKPLGIASMMDVPIWHHGQVYGVLCFEHVGALRRWQQSEQDFAIHLTDIASACLEACEHVAVRRRWETVIESLTESVAVMDPEGQMLHFNRAARRMLLERTGMRTWEELANAAELVDAADRPIPRNDWPFERALRRETVQAEIYGLVLKATGERRYLRLTCCPVIEGGEVEYVVFVAADATEEVFVERLKRELLSGLAHELKTPLAIAKGYAQQLESQTMPESWSRMLNAIIKACDRMDHLSETLLDLASTILGKLRLTQERVDLTDLALTVVRRAERGVPSHKFKLEMRANIPVVVDATRIAQAMRQVVDNAMTYSPEGSTIDVTLAADEGRATMSVRDRGIGIPAAAQRSIFELFFKPRAGTEHDKGGLGVGLFLAREIVRRHGGEMWFESAEGEGTTFHIGLPLAEET